MLHICVTTAVVAFWLSTGSPSPCYTHVDYILRLILHICVTTVVVAPLLNTGIPSPCNNCTCIHTHTHTHHCTVQTTKIVQHLKRHGIHTYTLLQFVNTHTYTSLHFANNPKNVFSRSVNKCLGFWGVELFLGLEINQKNILGFPLVRECLTF